MSTPELIRGKPATRESSTRERGLNGIIPTAFQLEDQRLLGDIAYWGTYPAVLALRQYAQANATAAPTILGVLDKYFVLVSDMVSESGTGLEEWGIHRWEDVSIVAEWMLEVYPNGRETMYLNLLTLLRYFGSNWTHYFTPGVFPTAAINEVDINFHGVNVAQAIKSEAVAFRYTHNASDVDATRSRIAIIDEYHGHVSGVLAADEHLAGKMPERGSELCTVVESMYSFKYVYTVLGDNAYADRVETLAFNALPATLLENMWEHQYLQQTNQIQAASIDPNPFATDGPDSSIFGLAPNYVSAVHPAGVPSRVLTTTQFLPDLSVDSM
ncbi:hypothetical protein B0H11DRAFT_2276051 [Mycena galericulata]|nr:hypothetical protein B0H11DRAFT_2276051 [Mycena galericulata]